MFSASRCLSWPHHFLRGSRRRPAPAGVSWDSLLTQPSDWYSTPEATRIAGNLLLYQRDTGGWPKNIDMTAVVTSADRARLTREKIQTDSTIDNGATTTEIETLARVFTASRRNCSRVISAVVRSARTRFVLASWSSQCWRFVRNDLRADSLSRVPLWPRRCSSLGH